MTAASGPLVATRPIRSLVGVRGVLSAVVVVVHLAPYADRLVPATAPLWDAVWRHGYVALDLFFVLSGFVIASGYRTVFRRWPGFPAYGRFLWARLSRFYPLHLAVLAALAVAALAGRVAGIDLTHGSDLGGDLASHVLLVQGWGGAHALTWNGPTWSLSSEWFCYLAVPLLLPAVMRVRTPRAAVLLYLGAVALPLVAYTVLGFGDAEITYRAPLFRAVGGFLAGAVLRRLLDLSSPWPARAGRAVGPLVLGTLAVIAALAGLGASSLLVLPLAGLIVLGLAEERGRTARLLGTRPALVAGEYSVALFIVHVPWLLAAALVITPARFSGAWGWLGVALLIGGAVLLTVVARVLVEAPAQRVLRGLVGRPHDAPAWPADRAAAVLRATDEVAVAGGAELRGRGEGTA